MAAVRARALLALTKKGSPVKPVYTSAYLLKDIVTFSKYATAMLEAIITG